MCLLVRVCVSCVIECLCVWLFAQSCVWCVRVCMLCVSVRVLFACGVVCVCVCVDRVCVCVCLFACPMCVCVCLFVCLSVGVCVFCVVVLLGG